MIFVLVCKYSENYGEYIGDWEVKKSSGIVVLEIRKEGKSYIYKIIVLRNLWLL